MATPVAGTPSAAADGSSTPIRSPSSAAYTSGWAATPGNRAAGVPVRSSNTSPPPRRTIMAPTPAPVQRPVAFPPPATPVTNTAAAGSASGGRGSYTKANTGAVQIDAAQARSSSSSGSSPSGRVRVVSRRSRPSALSRFFQALCCSTTNVSEPDRPSPYAAPADKSTTSLVPPADGGLVRGNSSAGIINVRGAPVGGASGAVGVQSGRKGAPRWVRPPPPTHRINNVVRPSSTFGDGPMLGPLLECDRNRKCLVLDLDETLVHSSFRPVPNADYILPVEIDGIVHHVYVIKRPGCDAFLQRMGECYEVVIFTASLAKYADPLLDMLDPYNVIRARLFREACVHHENAFVKDLSLLGRDPTDVIIVDNSPASYLFQPENALPCESFIDDMADRELYALANFLDTIRNVVDVRDALARWVSGTYNGLEGLEVHIDEEDMYELQEEEEEEEEAAAAAGVPDVASRSAETAGMDAGGRAGSMRSGVHVSRNPMANALDAAAAAAPAAPAPVFNISVQVSLSPAATGEGVAYVPTTTATSSAIAAPIITPSSATNTLVMPLPAQYAKVDMDSVDPVNTAARAQATLPGAHGYDDGAEAITRRSARGSESKYADAEREGSSGRRVETKLPFGNKYDDEPVAPGPTTPSTLTAGTPIAFATPTHLATAGGMA